MAALQKILAEYAKMRDNGVEVKASLNTLRDEIELLNEKEKQDLVRLLRAHEAGETQPVTTATPVQATASVQPITPIQAVAPAQPITPIQVATPPVEHEATRKIPLRNLAKERQTNEQEKTATNQVIWINCPNCNRSNQKHELVCYSCGHLLEASKSQQETQALAETNDLTYSEDFFDQDSVLILKARSSGKTFLAEPQKSDHELVVGRSAKGSAVMPDIDLADEDGDKLGVSRLHLNIGYDERSHTICVSDIGSANGTYLNGQRLHPHEVRVLRDHDEVRLGKLVLLVSFRHQ